MKHVSIVGTGLAGASAASFLSRHVRVTLLDRTGPAAGASGVAAGIVNPFAGLRASPAWHQTEALAALDGTLRRAGMFVPPPGLVRAARDEEQALSFQRRIGSNPDALTWLAPPQIHECWPEIHAPHGALLIHDGRAVDVAQLVNRLASDARADLRFGESGAIERVEEPGRIATQTGETISADVVMLCTGSALLETLSALPLHRIKGQVARFSAPGLSNQLPILAGDGYLVPEEDTVLVGSTFEHTFTDEKPTREGLSVLRGKAEALVPALGSAPVVEARAGVRMTVPGTRLPLLGPISRSGHIWVFNGLGAKGLLTAPLLASRLWMYLNDPTLLPAEVRPPVVL